jgi:glycosyltransferase involved in cell wall biosynthesis
MKIKILKLGWEFPPFSWGGLGVACSGLIAGLEEKGIDVELVLPNSTQVITKKLSKKKIFTALYEDLDKKIESYVLMCRKIPISILKKIDLIHAHDWMTYKAAIQLKKISKKPLILHVHSIEFDRNGRNNINHNICEVEKAGMECADRIIAVSNFTRERISRHYGIKLSKISVVHNGINLNSINKKTRMVQKNRCKKKVLFLGRLTSQKGPAHFIAAAYKILQRKKNIEFIIAGDGDLKKSLIRQVKALKMNSKVKFVGFLPHTKIDEAYKMADVYVMPSVCEPFGISPLEAMKNGTPVVLSKDAGVCEIIKNCLKIDFWNVTEIADKVIKLLESDKLYQKLSIEGKEEVNNFSWDLAAEKCINIYKDVL